MGVPALIGMASEGLWNQVISDVSFKVLSWQRAGASGVFRPDIKVAWHQTPTKLSCDLAKDSPNLRQAISIDNWHITLLFLVYSCFSYSSQTFFFTEFI